MQRSPCNSVAVNTNTTDQAHVTATGRNKEMTTECSERTSVFDDDINDQLESELFTREWIQYGSLESNSCPRHGLVPRDDCMSCTTNPALLEPHLNVTYVSAITPTDSEAVIVPQRYNELRGSGNELKSVQFMPLKAECYYTLAPYLANKTRPASRGEMLMNVCTPTTKTPCINIPWCIIGKYNGRAPSEFTHINKVDSDWVLFMPSTALRDIFTLMEEHDMYPTPNAHDGRSYNSSRLRLAGTVSSRVIKSAEWKVGVELASIRRYLNCDAVATATFTVTVHITPVKAIRGRYSRYRQLTLWVHSIQ